MNLCESCKKHESCTLRGVMTVSAYREIDGLGNCHRCNLLDLITRADLAAKATEIAELKQGVVAAELEPAMAKVNPIYRDHPDGDGIGRWKCPVCARETVGDYVQPAPGIRTIGHGENCLVHVASRLQDIPSDRILKEGEVAVDREFIYAAKGFYLAYINLMATKDSYGLHRAEVRFKIALAKKETK